MCEFKVGDRVRFKSIEKCNRNVDIWKENECEQVKQIRSREYVTIQSIHCTLTVPMLTFEEVLNSLMWYWRFELVKQPRSPKPKRKGYALWIYNIEKKLKKGKSR